VLVAPLASYSNSHSVIVPCRDQSNICQAPNVILASK